MSNVENLSVDDLFEGGKPLELRSLTSYEVQQLKDLFHKRLNKAGLSYRSNLFHFRTEIEQKKFYTFEQARMATVGLVDELTREKTTKQKGSEKEEKKFFKVAGTINELIFESVYYEEEPVYLTFKDNHFSVSYELEVDDVIFLPLKREMFPYRPYKLDEDRLKEINKGGFAERKAYQSLYREFDQFLDLEDEYKTLETIQVMETYNQHKLRTTSYLYHFGDNNSGKTFVLDLLNYLAYRPLKSISLPPADVYTFLGYHDEGIGTILEDEAENLSKPRYEEKMKIYRAGYKKGAVVPRIEFSRTGVRFQRFFRAFCCKAFSGLYIPNDKSFQQRLIPISMVEGEPEKDEITPEDEERFDNIKINLLAWRMRTYFKELPQIETKLHGRIKELWKPKLQIAYGLPAESIIKALAMEKLKQKEEERQTCLEAYLTKSVIFNHVEFGGMPIPFSAIWDVLKVVLGVQDKPETDNGVITPQFGEVTKTYIGRRLTSVFGGQKHLKGRIGRTYTFKERTLLRLARKYRLATPSEINGLNGFNRYTWFRNIYQLFSDDNSTSSKDSLDIFLIRDKHKNCLNHLNRLEKNIVKNIVNWAKNLTSNGREEVPKNLYLDILKKECKGDVNLAKAVNSVLFDKKLLIYDKKSETVKLGRFLDE